MKGEGMKTNPLIKIIHYNGFGSELFCPQCGGSWLHHVQVDVFSREEDQPSQKITIDQAGNMSTIRNSIENPSLRRDGLRITFDCEMCDIDLALTIVQHKGQTFLNWELSESAGE